MQSFKQALWIYEKTNSQSHDIESFMLCHSLTLFCLAATELKHSTDLKKSIF